jgi:exopolysaccharide biosynthesis protein
MKDTLFKKGICIALIVIIAHSLGYFYYRSTKYSYMEGMEGKKPEKVINHLDAAIEKIEEVDGEKSDQSDEQQQVIGAIQGAKMRVEEFLDKRNKFDMNADEKNDDPDDDGDTSP